MIRNDPSSRRIHPGASPVMHLAMHDGFERDTVVITVNGEEVYSEDALSTDYRVGVAGAVDVDLEGFGLPIEVVFIVHTRSLTGRIRLSAREETWVSVNCRDGELEIRRQNEAFRYM